jgi:predicted N-acetyltransferase YhbS
MDGFIIRPETAADLPGIFEVNRQAFGQENNVQIEGAG